ncbi:hypothetical protein CBER1_04418 [Cercospora berteroae]|uniref:Uncharacterized protein n=1 Tax=Cercospora berteroae TaxID=357750 RepID=A0A2S6CCI3_9PEZI|nr:hypothetical protein CBER1_04418 [Cercospora berteroae]
MAEDKQQQASKSKNVLGQPLSWFARGEGYHKDGYCHHSASEDKQPRGNYSIAATLTHSFLQSEYGDDKPYKGHSAGQKMCLSAHDFKSAVREMGPDTGPKVDLSATDERALEVVSLDLLKNYAAKGASKSENKGAEGAQGSARQGGGAQGVKVKESSQIGGDQGQGSRDKSQNVKTDAKPEGSGGQKG